MRQGPAAAAERRRRPSAAEGAAREQPWDRMRGGGGAIASSGTCHYLSRNDGIADYDSCFIFPPGQSVLENWFNRQVARQTS